MIIKRMTTGFALLLAVALMFGGVTAMASSGSQSGGSAVQQIDPDRTDGSISLNMEYKEDGQKKSMQGGSVSLYTVASVKVEDGYQFDVSAGKFAGIAAADEIPGMTSEDLDQGNEDLADRLAAAVESSDGITEDITVQIENGKASFMGLKPGLYLIIQSKAADNGLTINPFLISIPDAKGSYQIVADPKTSLPTTTPDQPKPSKPAQKTKPAGLGKTIPQTGQLWWPVPFAAGAGVILLVAGGFMRRRAKG